MGIKDFIEDNILLFDGAMGTMLQKEGLKLGQNPEVLNITNPEVIKKIHKKYIYMLEQRLLQQILLEQMRKSYMELHIVWKRLLIREFH